jgi:hypothetical protein
MDLSSRGHCGAGWAKAALALLQWRKNPISDSWEVHEYRDQPDDRGLFLSSRKFPNTKDPHTQSYLEELPVAPIDPFPSAMKASSDRKLGFGFQDNSKFALLTIENVYAELSTKDPLRLSDGTWMFSKLPLTDFGVWKQWIGTIRAEQLSKANMVLLREQIDANPRTLDAVHMRLGDSLSRTFYLLQLSGVLEYENAHLLTGSCVNGQSEIRQMSEVRRFFPSKGYTRLPLNVTRLEAAIQLRNGLSMIETSASSARIIRGLNTLFDGLSRGHGQDRLHQFVRSLEALILPDTGKTKRQFVHRCQTFTLPCEATQSILGETFDMRSDTEHLHDWERSLRSYPTQDREDVASQRTRQLELLASFAYSRILCDGAVSQHFASERAQQQFWTSKDDATRRSIWGRTIDITAVPLVSNCDQWGRAPLEL